MRRSYSTATSPNAGLKSPIRSGNSTRGDEDVVDRSRFQYLLHLALAKGALSEARRLVAHFEEESSTGCQDSPTHSELIVAKAKIADAAGDSWAAHAILVSAIEKNPHEKALRITLTESMIANGQAQNVRPVLEHIARSTTQVAKIGQVAKREPLKPW